MAPSLVRTFLPSDYRTTLQNALNSVAGGNVAVINMINDVARSGGDIGPDNRAPSIGGTAPTSIMVGSNYSFTPSVAGSGWRRADVQHREPAELGKF